MSNSLHDDIQRARVLHQHGMLADADTLYQSVLRRQPGNHEVLHLAGLLALQAGRPEQGVALIGKALRLNGDDAGAHSNLGAGLRALRRYPAALASCDRAIALRPDFPPAHSNRGLVLADLQRPEEALASHDRAIALRPAFAEAHGNRGVVLAGLHRAPEALASFDRAIALRPNHAESHYNRGKLLAAQQRHEEALASYDQAIALKQDYAEAYCTRGLVLAELRRPAEALASHDRTIELRPDDAATYCHRGDVLADLQRPEAALASFDRAIELQPDSSDAYAGRGCVLADLRRYDEALASCDQAIALQPDHAGAHCNRGVVLARMQRPMEALTSHDHAIMLDPDHTETHCNRSLVLAGLGRHTEALANYDRAIALRPDSAEAHWNRSHSLLALGEFAPGWQQFEWRKRLTRPAGHRTFPQPVWLGQDDIADKTLFVHWEQGLGDTIQFCRYATPATARGARVVMSVQDPLRRLIGTLGPDIEVIRASEEPATFDWHCPMMSLPLAFGTTLATIPHAVPYFVAEAEAVDMWQSRLAALPGLRVGLCWAGNARQDQPAAHAIDRRRSISLAQYAPLAETTGAQFISLQKGEAATQATKPPPGLIIHDWTADLHDFADTAALIATLDLVITVDTAVAHLAGALGKPVWILNRFDACWRWLTNRTDSPWYPAARLFRQPAPGDWDSVIDAVTATLHRMIADAAGGAGSARSGD